MLWHSVRRWTWQRSGFHTTWLSFGGWGQREPDCLSYQLVQQHLTTDILSLSIRMKRTLITFRSIIPFIFIKSNHEPNNTLPLMSCRLNLLVLGWKELIAFRSIIPFFFIKSNGTGFDQYPFLQPWVQQYAPTDVLKFESASLRMKRILIAFRSIIPFIFKKSNGTGFDPNPFLQPWAQQYAPTDVLQVEHGFFQLIGEHDVGTCAAVRCNIRSRELEAWWGLPIYLVECWLGLDRLADLYWIEFISSSLLTSPLPSSSLQAVQVVSWGMHPGCRLMPVDQQSILRTRKNMFKGRCPTAAGKHLPKTFQGVRGHTCHFKIKRIPPSHVQPSGQLKSVVFDAGLCRIWGERSIRWRPLKPGWTLATEKKKKLTCPNPLGPMHATDSLPFLYPCYKNDTVIIPYCVNHVM